MIDALPAIRKTIAPISMTWGAGMPTLPINSATLLKLGILFPRADIKKIVQSKTRPMTARIP